MGRTLQVERGGGCERRERREGAHGPHAVTCRPWGSAPGAPSEPPRLGPRAQWRVTSGGGARCAMPSPGGERAAPFRAQACAA